ncbi:MAG: ferrochelatase [Nitrospinae bacterium]|nr:ferrochelatase [Nitrospinota bacterium]
MAIQATGSQIAQVIGVLLMAHGSPDSLDEIAPFLQHVRGGRPTPPALVEEIREHYRLIGGRSPLLDLTQAQAKALEGRLKVDGVRFRVYVGMRNWHPFIKDTVKRMVADSVRRVVAVSLAPQYSHLSVGAYQQALETAQSELGVSLDVTNVESWHDHPLLLQAFAERVQEAFAQLPADACAQVHTIFTAHSLPERMLKEGDPYPREVERTAAGVARRLGLLAWDLGYQSQGATAEPWIGPTLDDLLERCAARGQRRILLVPVGFVCDHMEILYDIDIVAQRIAKKKGLSLMRTTSLNTSPCFIEALADVVRRSTCNVQR